MSNLVIHAAGEPAPPRIGPFDYTLPSHLIRQIVAVLAADERLWPIYLSADGERLTVTSASGAQWLVTVTPVTP